MKKRLLASVFSVSLLVLPISSSAQSTDMSAALLRMDAIIAEMQTLRAEFASLVASVGTSPTPAVQGAVSGSVLGDDLRYGSTNDDIARIQRLLATDPTIYAYGVDSGYFGPKTQEAIRLFQSRFGLDTVGVIGPSTRALLETFFAAYPGENYPADVLKKAAPQVAGATVSSTASAPTPAASVDTGGLSKVAVTEDDGEYIVRSYNTDGSRNRDIVLYPEDFDELIELIARKLDVSESAVRSLVDEDDVSFEQKKEDDDDDDDLDNDDYSERSAEKWLEAADDAIDEARDEINDAEDDGEEIDEADELFDEAKEEYEKAEDAFDDEDWDDAVKNAEDAIELAEEAIDAIGEGGGDEIDSIEVDIRDNEAEVTVEYEDGDDEEFTVNDDDEDDIIEEIADELNIDEDEVEDLVEFDYGAIESIVADRSGGQTRVRIEFRSGFTGQLLLDETDEDDIIEEVADAFNLDEDDVESDIEFDL